MSEAWIEAWLDQQAFERFEVTPAGQTRYRASYLAKIQDQGGVRLERRPLSDADRKRIEDEIEGAYEVGYPPDVISPPVSLAALNSVSPATIVTNDTRDLLLTGTLFEDGFVAFVEGAALPTTFVSATQLTAPYRTSGLTRTVPVKVKDNAGRWTNTITLDVFDWSPMLVPGLQEWWDANDPTTFTFSSGAEVSEWAARFGPTAMPQPTLTFQPTRASLALNRGASVSFGNGDILGSWGTGYTWDPATEVLDVFVVTARTTTGTGGGATCVYFYSDHAALNHHGFQPGVGYRNSSYSDIASPAFAVDNAWHLFEWTARPGGGITLKRSQIDSTFTAYSGAYAPATSHWLWFSDSDGSVYNTDHANVEVLIYVTPTGVSDPERAAIVDWIAKKWAVT